MPKMTVVERYVDLIVKTIDQATAPELMTATERVQFLRKLEEEVTRRVRLAHRFGESS